MGLALALHVVAAVIWVGGMFFALLCLRPALTLLDPQLRLRLFAGTLSRFFRWVFASIVIVLVTGLWMVFGHYDGLRNVNASVHLMLAIGIVMMLISAHAYFAPYKRLKRLIARSNWTEAAHQSSQIRWLVAVNLVLGLLVVAIAASGRYWPAIQP
jgi:uncharacterized membrane protein